MSTSRLELPESPCSKKNPVHGGASPFLDWAYIVCIFNQSKSSVFIYFSYLTSLNYFVTPIAPKQASSLNFHTKPVSAMQWNPRYKSMVTPIRAHRVALSHALITRSDDTFYSMFITPRLMHVLLVLMIHFTLCSSPLRFHAGIQQPSGSPSPTR